jgi:hypothetical protein
VKVTGWRPLRKATMRGLVSIELSVGLIITDAIVHVGANGPWVAMPGKPWLEDGRHRIDPATGRPAYSNILAWRSRTLADKFSATVVAELLKLDPRALDGEQP